MYKEKQRVSLASVDAAIPLPGFKFVVGIMTGSLGILSEPEVPHRDNSEVPSSADRLSVKLLQRRNANASCKNAVFCRVWGSNREFGRTSKQFETAL